MRMNCIPRRADYRSSVVVFLNSAPSPHHQDSGQTAGAEHSKARA